MWMGHQCAVASGTSWSERGGAVHAISHGNGVLRARRLAWLSMRTCAVVVAALCALLVLPPAKGLDVLAALLRQHMAERIDPRVRAQADMQTMVPVFLVLTEQPQGAILERARALSNLKNQAAEERYRRTLQSDTASAEEVRQARAGLDAITLAMRQEAFREIEAEIGPQQAAVESRLQGLGATRIGRYNGINMLTAEVPSGALAALEADSAIARVWPVEKLQALIVNSVPAIGAPTFWTNGYTGAG